jgi:hypothetical protein
MIRSEALGRGPRPKLLRMRYAHRSLHEAKSHVLIHRLWEDPDRTDRVVIVDGGNDRSVTHRSLLTRRALRLLSARTEGGED